MIAWRLDGAVAELTLGRIEARNAVPVAGWRALAAAAGEIAAGPARATILASAAPFFSAGADIAEFARFRADPAACADFRIAMRAGIEAVAALPMPVIAAIDGGCFGAAVALALACDLRIAGDAARFAVTPARLGIGYPGGDVARLRAQVGQGQAARLLFSATTIDADEAARIRLAEQRTRHALEAAGRWPRTSPPTRRPRCGC